MKNTIFTGAGVAIITPMLPDGSIDYAGLGKNIDDQIENGTDAIIICGTTGESSTMTDEEHRKCIEFAVQHTQPGTSDCRNRQQRYQVRHFPFSGSTGNGLQWIADCNTLL